MGKKLTAEERAERKRARNKKAHERLFASYKREGTKKGSPEEWKRIAEYAMLIKGKLKEYLALLDLTTVPASIADLKKARKKAMLENHPDRGGSEETAQKINEAFTILSKLVKD